MVILSDICNQQQYYLDPRFVITAETQNIGNFSHYNLDIKSVPKLGEADDISETEIVSYVRPFLQLHLTLQEVQD